MTEELNAREQALVAAGRNVARLAGDIAADCEANKRPPREVWQAYREAGLKGLRVPREKGGHAISALAMAQISEALGAADSTAALTFVPQEYCMAAIAAYGHHPWHEAMLRRLLAGECSTGFLLTEPQAGSDAAALTTVATRTEQGWRLNGAKAWVSNARDIDEHFVFAQTESGSGAKGIAAFLVPRDAAGLSIGQPYALIGGHSAGICDVRFDDVTLAPERMVVPPGEGLKAALAAIDLARVNVAAMCCGMLRVALDTALDYASKRHAFGRPIAEFQGLQWQLADVATELEAARLLTYDAARQLDRDGKAAVAAAHAKKFASLATLRGVEACMQAMGANGLRHDWPLARFFAQAKIAQCLDGTTEIQNVVIARALFAPYRRR